MRAGGVLNAPGSGWERLAARVAAEIPLAEVDAVWTFRALRHEGREFGTAIICRRDGDRRRIYTGRFAHTLKGRERGHFEATIEEVGSGPPEAVTQLIAGVRRRMDDEVPESVEPSRWFAHLPAPETAPDGPPGQG